MVKLSIDEIKAIRAAYARDLRTETQASKSVRKSMSDIVALCDEVLEKRRAECPLKEIHG